MNICLIPEKYPPDPGGLAVSASRLARGLADEGHQVHVATVSHCVPPKHTTHSAEGNLTVHCTGASRRTDDTMADWFDLVGDLHRQHGFDILHGYYLAQAGYVTSYAGRYLGVPSVVSARGNDLDRTVFDPGRAGGILWALRHADAVTAVSQDLARRARALAPGRLVETIPNGVNVDVFQPSARDTTLLSQLGLDERPVIGFVGEARLKKGLAVLLQTFASLDGDCPAQLLLVGGVRKDDKDILDVFRRQNPGTALQLVPYQSPEELPRYYNLLDVLVLPSLRDGLPNALLEGMACGRAAVASAVGGIPDVVRDGHNGVLVAPDDADSLKAAIVELLAFPEKRAALGTNARQTVADGFTPELELAANQRLYRRLNA